MKIRVSTRVVLIFKNRVIKIPISLRGYLQCLQESYIWDKYKHLNLLGELYWFKYGMICMKRYKPTKYVYHLEVFKIKNKIEELNITMCDLYKKDNWGVDEDGKRFLIDYGINEEISKMYNL